MSERLRYLAGNVATADLRPTDQQGEVHTVLKAELDSARRALETILSTDLPALNRMLQQRNLSGIIMEEFFRRRSRSPLTPQSWRPRVPPGAPPLPGGIAFYP